MIYLGFALGIVGVWCLRISALSGWEKAGASTINIPAVLSAAAGILLCLAALCLSARIGGEPMAVACAAFLFLCGWLMAFLPRKRESTMVIEDFADLDALNKP